MVEGSVQTLGQGRKVSIRGDSLRFVELSGLGLRVEGLGLKSSG